MCQSFRPLHYLFWPRQQLQWERGFRIGMRTDNLCIFKGSWFAVSGTVSLPILHLWPTSFESTVVFTSQDLVNTNPLCQVVMFLNPIWHFQLKKLNWEPFFIASCLYFLYYCNFSYFQTSQLQPVLLSVFYF